MEDEVWLCPLKDYDALLEWVQPYWQSLLTEQEGARFLTYWQASDKINFLFARFLVRHVLRWPQWDFALSARGRPLPLGPGHFNISHTQGMVALFFSPCPQIGIDVEIPRPLDWRELAPGIASPREMAWLTLEATQGRQNRAFFQLWTLKEAWLKALGIGLVEDLPSLCTLTLPTSQRLCHWLPDGMPLAVVRLDQMSATDSVRLRTISQFEVTTLIEKYCRQLA